MLALAGVALGDVVDDGGLDDIARRLTASGRFETVEVHKRYRSLSATDPIALVIVVRERPRARLAGRLMFLPILGYEEGYGVSYGMRFSVDRRLAFGVCAGVEAAWEEVVFGELAERLTRVIVGLEYDSVSGAFPRDEVKLSAAVERLSVAGRPAARAVRAWSGVHPGGECCSGGHKSCRAPAERRDRLEDATLAAHLAALHDQGRAPSSAATAVAAACFRARLAGEPSPAGERTARVLAGYRRTAAERGRRQARPPLRGRGPRGAAKSRR